MESIQVKRLSETARLPVRATEGSAGYDLFADWAAEIAAVIPVALLAPTFLK